MSRTRTGLPEYERADTQHYTASRFQAITLMYDAICDLCPDLKQFEFGDATVVLSELNVNRNTVREVSLSFTVKTDKQQYGCRVSGSMHFENNAWSRTVLSVFESNGVNLLPGGKPFSYTKTKSARKQHFTVDFEG